MKTLPIKCKKCGRKLKQAKDGIAIPNGVESDDEPRYAYLRWCPKCDVVKDSKEL